MYEYKEVFNLFDKEIKITAIQKNISYIYNAVHIALNNFEVQKRMKFQRTNIDSYIFYPHSSDFLVLNNKHP